MNVVKGGWVIPALVLVTVLVLASGCQDVSFGSQKLGDFGDSVDEKVAVGHFNVTWGSPEGSGMARFVEPVVSTGLVNNIPVDSVSVINRSVPRIYFWAYYDNFRKGDQFGLSWTFNGHLAAPVNTASGDFGRVVGEIVPPEGGWPVGDHAITVSDMSGLANATVRFRIVDGPTISVLPAFRAPPGDLNTGQQAAGDTCDDPYAIRCDGKCTPVLHDVKNCGTCGNACPRQYYCEAGVCKQGYVAIDTWTYSAQWGDQVYMAGEDMTGLGGVCLKLFGPGIDAQGVRLSCVESTWNSSESDYRWEYRWNTLAVPVSGIVRQAGQYEVRVYDQDYSNFVPGFIEFSAPSWTVTCPQGQSACGSSCVNLNTDPANCGSCGIGCGSGQTCQYGQCASSCTAGTTNCDGSCVNLYSDSANCGSCGISCGSGQTCQSGQCASTCAGGTTNCDGSCVNLNSDSANCGSCGHSCGALMVCSNGACVQPGGGVTITCQSGKTKCGVMCVDLLTDTGNCGGCGITCGAERPCCVNGGCVGPSQCPCPSGQTNCGGGCTNLLTDNSNCGSCGHSCGQLMVCSNGACVKPGGGVTITCQSGKTKCGMMCVDLQSDMNNCGACGTVCNPYTQVCSSGTCFSIVR